MTHLPLQKRIIYGPVRSRRLGHSLGINLMPTSFKLCSLNCSYCQYGWTRTQSLSAKDFREQLPSVHEVSLAVLRALHENAGIDYLTFSGNGEPTLHPDFPAIVEEVVHVRNEIRPQVKIALLSNSTTCSRPAIRKAIEKIDLPIMKLDVGNEQAFKRMNHGIPPITFESIVLGLKALNHYVIQTMFVRGRVDNSTDWEVKSWIARLQELHPLSVQIYSLDRTPANERLERVPPSRLKAIARLAEESTSLKVEVYGN